MPSVNKSRLQTVYCIAVSSKTEGSDNYTRVKTKQKGSYVDMDIYIHKLKNLNGE